MRPVRIITAFVFAAAVAVTGCTAHATVVDPTAAPAPAATAPTATTPPTTATTNRPGPTAKSTPTTTAAPRRLYFTTPPAAMRYLTAAYNRNDLVALGHVTTPIARANLLAMRRTAVNLQLVGCTANAGRGDFLCSFHRRSRRQVWLVHDRLERLQLSSGRHATAPAPHSAARSLASHSTSARSSAATAGRLHQQPAPRPAGQQPRESSQHRPACPVHPRPRHPAPQQRKPAHHLT